MAAINYSSFSTATGTWPTNPSQPYLYKLITSDFTFEGSDIFITFNNLPAGMTVAAADSTTEPFDSVYFDTDYEPDLLLTKKTTSNQWTGDNGVVLMAAYTSGGYWAYGATGAYSPGVILTGSGTANSVITDIVWESSYGAAGTPPAPFNSSTFGVSAYNWASTTANEFYSSYSVVNTNTIRVSTDFGSLDPALRNLYVNFNKP